jgi:hypothetical protein
VAPRFVIDAGAASGDLAGGTTRQYGDNRAGDCRIADPHLAQADEANALPSQLPRGVERDDDYTFGVLHSRVHELWARGTGTQLREVESGFRYTPTTCFETFPFPRPTDEQREAIAVAARRLVELRDGWLNPPGLSDEELGKRTLTNLYNQRPTWLANAHATLDAAVLAAYGWPPDLPVDEILARLLELNLSREPA